MTAESRRMDPADVPDMRRIDALAFNAVTLADTEEWLRLTDRQKVARAVLAAVLPEFERQVREKVSEEILADVEPFFAARIGPEMWEAAYRAAHVAKGVS